MERTPSRSPETLANLDRRASVSKRGPPPGSIHAQDHQEKEAAKLNDARDPALAQLRSASIDAGSGRATLNTSLDTAGSAWREGEAKRSEVREGLSLSPGAGARSPTQPAPADPADVFVSRSWRTEGPPSACSLPLLLFLVRFWYTCCPKLWLMLV